MNVLYDVIFALLVWFWPCGVELPEAIHRHPEYWPAAKRYMCRHQFCEFNYDPAIIRSTQRRYATHPPISDLNAFNSNRAASRRELDWARDSIARLQELRAWHPYEEWLIDLHIDELRKYERAFSLLNDACYDAECTSAPAIYWIRGTLAKLREEIGDEAYYAGSMPKRWRVFANE